MVRVYIVQVMSGACAMKTKTKHIGCEDMARQDDARNETGMGLLGFVALAMLLVLGACGTTSLTASWYDDSFKQRGTLADLLIIAVTKDQTVRRLYEDSFVGKLSGKDARAVQSYTLTDPDIEPEPEEIEAAVAEVKAKYVLITRHLGTDTKEHYQPPVRVPVYSDPYYSRMNRYYPLAYHEVYSPGYNYSVTTVSLESNIYEAATGDLVWSARSESVDPKMTKNYVEELVNVFVADLVSKGLL